MRLISRLLIASLMGVVVLKGVAIFEHVTSRVTIAPGPLSLFDANGSSVIVHANEDQGATGAPGGSGGPRIACGVIEQIP